MKYRNRTSLVVLATALALIAVSCAGSGNDGTPNVTSTSTTPSDRTPDDAPAVGAFPEGPSALSTLDADEFPDPLVDVS